MTFYLGIRTNKELSHVPLIDAITLNIDGRSVVCHWDETSAGAEGNVLSYRLKGVSFVTDQGVEEYADGLIKCDSKIYIEDILWQEDDDEEEFNSMACWLDIDATAITYEDIIGDPGNLYVPETREQYRERYIPPNPKHINCESFGHMDGMSGSCLWCKEMCPYQWEMCKDEDEVRRYLFRGCKRNEAIDLIDKTKKIMIL